MTFCPWSGFLMGPLVGGLFNPMQCGMFAVCGLALCMFWVIFALPETLKPTTQLEVRPQRHAPQNARLDIFLVTA